MTKKLSLWRVRQKNSIYWLYFLAEDNSNIKWTLLEAKQRALSVMSFLTRNTFKRNELLKQVEQCLTSIRFDMSLETLELFDFEKIDNAKRAEKTIKNVCYVNLKNALETSEQPSEFIQRYLIQ